MALCYFYPKHPEYRNYGNYPNDIALLEVTDDLYGTSQMTQSPARPACLQEHGTLTYEERPMMAYENDLKGCWVTGWGETMGNKIVYSLVSIETRALRRGHSLSSLHYSPKIMNYIIMTLSLNRFSWHFNTINRT